MATHLAALDLEIRYGGLELRVPVHQPAVAVDQALAMQRHEHLAHRTRQALVHGEPFARPVERRAETPELLRDGPAGLGLPAPHPFGEPGTAQRLAGRPLACQQPLDHHLRGDPGVVHARLPQRVASLHPAPAHQDVLHRHRQRMAHVQAAGHVGRRNHDGEGVGVAGGVGGKCA